jgi:hypothetical protein
MTELMQTAEFLNRARRRMRYGALSRAPLRLLRLEWKQETVECDWLMRESDPWDRFIPENLAEKLHSQQALRDALSLRDMVFAAFSHVEQAQLRMFRNEVDQPLELMMSGMVHRSNEILQRVPSVAMRAKLCGFEFSLTEGVLVTRNRVSCV